MRGISWRSVASVCAAVLASAAVCVGSAAAKPPPASNGQILFISDSVGLITVNPDGTDPQSFVPGAQCGRWSPGGTLIATCGAPDGVGSTIVLNPDTNTTTELFPPDVSLFLACYVWSPDGLRLACEHFQSPADPSQFGVYSIDASTGDDIQPIVLTPGNEIMVGDYSPDGGRFVFQLTDPTRPPRANNALFVVNVDGSGLQQITPWGFPDSEFAGSWSPDGQWILFDNHRGNVFLVHPNGSGMHQIPLAGFSNRSFAFQPSWSPDGTKFVFGLFTPVGTPRSGPSSNFQEGIYTANADGSDVQPVSIAPPGEHFDSPDWGTHPLIAP